LRLKRVAEPSNKRAKGRHKGQFGAEFVCGQGQMERPIDGRGRAVDEQQVELREESNGRSGRWSRGTDPNHFEIREEEGEGGGR
jgi:hypothetical protein